MQQQLIADGRVTSDNDACMLFMLHVVFLLFPDYDQNMCNTQHACCSFPCFPFIAPSTPECLHAKSALTASWGICTAQL
jgi:hypothetical protein